MPKKLGVVSNGVGVGEPVEKEVVCGSQVEWQESEKNLGGKKAGARAWEKAPKKKNHPKKKKKTTREEGQIRVAKTRSLENHAYERLKRKNARLHTPFNLALGGGGIEDEEGKENPPE